MSNRTSWKWNGPAVWMSVLAASFILSSCGGGGPDLDERLSGAWKHAESTVEGTGALAEVVEESLNRCDLPIFYDDPLEFRSNGEMVDASGNVFEYSFPDDKTIRFASASGNQEFTYEIDADGYLAFRASGYGCRLEKA